MKLLTQYELTADLLASVDFSDQTLERHTRHCYSKKRDLYETENGSRCLYCTEEINYMWVIEQALGQDGWILSKFFFCVFMDRGKVEVYFLAKKYPAIFTGQSWSKEDLLYDLWAIFHAGYIGNARVGKMVPSCLLG